MGVNPTWLLLCYESLDAGIGEETGIFFAGGDDIFNCELYHFQLGLLKKLHKSTLLSS